MLRNVSIVLVMCLLLAVSVQVFGVPDKEEDPTGGASYVGADACKKCHFKQHRQWKKMKHFKAWEVLQGKLKSPDQKDSKGRLCVSCHVTGFGHEDRNGFKDPESSRHLLGVGCEACHGPGSRHVEVSKKLLDEKRKKFNEGEPIYTVLKTANCTNCHNPHITHEKMAD